MDKQCKYQKYQKYVSYDNELTWEPVSPPEYQKGELVEYNSPDCGGSVVLYKWVIVDGEYECVGYDKHKKLQKYVSYDNELTWEPVSPAEYTAGELIEVDSTDCGYHPPQYRWVESGYTCINYDKYEKVIQQVSYDGGINWANVEPMVYSATTFVEANASYCEYEPNVKFKALYTDGIVRKINCDGSVLNSNDTNSYSLYGIVIGYIGDCVQSIAPSAFSMWNGHQSNLIDVKFPNSLTVIGNHAFDSCLKLESLYIPDSVTSIDYGAFNSCTGLTSIRIPNHITSIGQNTFATCVNLKRLNSDTDGVFNIPSGVTLIGSAAFSRCSGVTSIVIPDSTTYIGDAAFKDCSSLSSCTIGSGVTRIAKSAFTSCYNLTSIDIPDSVTVIDYIAFAACEGLTSCTIGNGVTRIAADAFKHCISLTSVTIGSGVTTIGDGSFVYCYSLESVTIIATTPPSFCGYAFDADSDDYKHRNYPIYVPAESVEAYKVHHYWNKYADRIQAIPTP